MQHRRSGINERTLARQLGCNKQEFSRKRQGNIGARKRPMRRARGGSAIATAVFAVCFALETHFVVHLNVFWM
ncbi:hypothetical protein QL285_085666 [Trifolium repens]|nr:hypothetical protein QL285_085666 [Trifolium repens]